MIVPLAFVAHSLLHNSSQKHQQRHFLQLQQLPFKGYLLYNILIYIIIHRVWTYFNVSFR